MRTSAGITRTPYAVMGAMRTGRGDGPPWVCCRRRTLGPAMKWVHDMTYAWARLVGPYAPILVWWVRDDRDGTDHYLPADATKGAGNGTEGQGLTTLW